MANFIKQQIFLGRKFKKNQQKCYKKCKIIKMRQNADFFQLLTLKNFAKFF